MVQRIRKYCTGTVVIFILLFGVIWYNSIYNQHFHILSNGSIVVHSHPYTESDGGSSPFKSHHHSSFELFSIENLHILYFISALLIITLEFFRKAKYQETATPVYSIIFSFNFKGRAPPLID